MEKKLIKVDQQAVRLWDYHVSQCVPLVQDFIDQFNRLDIGGIENAKDLHSAIKEPGRFVEERLLTLVEVPQPAGPFQVDKKKFLSTLETPNISALLAASFKITKANVNMRGYVGNVSIQDGKAVVDPLKRAEMVESASTYAVGEEQIEYYQQLEQFVEAYKKLHAYQLDHNLGHELKSPRFVDLAEIIEDDNGELIVNYRYFHNKRNHFPGS